MAIIAHLDMDAFFAAVEERDNPQWRGLPIVVGSDPKEGHGRGVVSTANYAARAYGIRSAMPIRHAWHLAQIAKMQGKAETIFVPGFWRSYSSASKRIMDIINQFASHTQQTGVDETYLDLSFTESFSEAKKIAQHVKQEIKTKERLTCSIGLGPNKLVAKIAANFQKPDGLTVVFPEQAETFLEPLSVRAIPGIGPKTEATLNKHGIKIIRELKERTVNELAEIFGLRSPAPMLQHLVLGARGLGSSTFSPSEPPKSISEQQTFWKDTRDPLLLTEKLHGIANNLIRYLQKESHITIYRTVMITVRFSDFESHTYSHTLKQPTNSLEVLKTESLRLLLPFLDHRKNPQGKLIRLIGLRIEKFQSD